jgi:MFS family permease
MQLPAGYRALLSNRAFCLVLGTVALVHAAHSLFLTALPWLMLEVAGSERAVGWATAANFLPYLLVSIPAGALVDRVDRKRMMLTASLVRAGLAVAVPVLYVAGLLGTGLALLLAFMLSAAGLVAYLARCSILPQIVPQDQLLTANSVNMLVTGLAMVVMAASAGFIVRVLGLAGAFAIIGGLVALSAVPVAMLHMDPRRGQAIGGQAYGWRHLLQGLSHVRRAPVLRTLITLEGLYFVLADGLVATGLPLFVRNSLHGGPAEYGYLRAAGNLGMLLGAVWLGRLSGKLPKERLVVWGWLGYGLALLCHPLFPAMAPALLASCLAGMIGNWIPVTESALLQETVPSELTGRVFGVYNMIAPGAGAISGFIGGALAGTLSGGGLIAVGAAVACANAFLGRFGGLWRRQPR